MVSRWYISPIVYKEGFRSAINARLMEINEVSPLTKEEEIAGEQLKCANILINDAIKQTDLLQYLRDHPNCSYKTSRDVYGWVMPDDKWCVNKVIAPQRFYDQLGSVHGAISFDGKSLDDNASERLSLETITFLVNQGITITAEDTIETVIDKAIAKTGSPKTVATVWL